MPDLPLFPLNTVLFPGMPITLHIFEPRYREMIDHCLVDQKQFGVVLIKDGLEALGPVATPHLIGCSARIVQVEHLTDGRMNIVAIGQQRFVIRELDYSRHSYLVGSIDFIPLKNDLANETLAANLLVTRVRAQLKRYLGILDVADATAFNPSELPEDPTELAYLAAYLLQIPEEQKQSLLAIESVGDFLSTLNDMFRREVVVLELLMKKPSLESNSPFSAN